MPTPSAQLAGNSLGRQSFASSAAVCDSDKGLNKRSSGKLKKAFNKAMLGNVVIRAFFKNKSRRPRAPADVVSQTTSLLDSLNSFQVNGVAKRFQKFKSKGSSQVKEYCSALTKEDCRRQSGSFIACEKVRHRLKPYKSHLPTCNIRFKLIPFQENIL